MAYTPPPPTPTKPYKAVVAFALTFIGALIATIEGRGPDFETMNAMDWLIVLGSALVTAGAVYGITNPATR